MIPFQTKGVFIVMSHIALSQYGMHGIVIDSKPELFRVSEQKGPILQKSHPPRQIKHVEVCDIILSHVDTSFN